MYYASYFNLWVGMKLGDAVCIKINRICGLFVQKIGNSEIIEFKKKKKMEKMGNNSQLFLYFFI